MKVYVASHHAHDNRDDPDLEIFGIYSTLGRAWEVAIDQGRGTALVDEWELDADRVLVGRLVRWIDAGGVVHGDGI